MLVILPFQVLIKFLLHKKIKRKRKRKRKSSQTVNSARLITTKSKFTNGPSPLAIDKNHHFFKGYVTPSSIIQDGTIEVEVENITAYRSLLRTRNFSPQA